MRIAITGIGLISAIGLNRQETVASLLREESGVRTTEQTSVLGLPSGRVSLSDDELRRRLGISPEEAIGRCALLGIAAAREAMEDAGIGQFDHLTIDNFTINHAMSNCQIVNCPIVKSNGVALISGTTVGGMDCTERYWEDWQRGEHTDYISQHEAGETTRQIAAHLGAFSYIATPSTACSSALNAIMVGANLLRTGRARCAVVGGTECLSRFHISGFHSLMILDHALCRPFSSDRAGLNLGEGAGYLVLESEADANARGAKIWGYLSGYANSCDAYHQTASSPDGEGAYLAMQGALEMAGLRPEEIDYINAHGTGTPNNDLSESRAIYRLFGDHIPAVSSTKPFTGHTTSASGGIEAAICLLCMQEGFIPANLHFTETAEGLIQPIEKTTQATLRHVLCNAFGFGGNDSAIVLSKEVRASQPPYKEGAQGIAVPNTQRLTMVRHGGRTSISSQIITLNAQQTFQEIDYKRYIPAMEARRMTPQLRQCVAAAMQQIESDPVDAIICATRYGCIVNSIGMLQTMLVNGEEAVKPTQFIQSTHNTLASIIANKTQNHGYNMTYSDGEQSWENALLDAQMLLELGMIQRALVIAFDEHDATWDKMIAINN